MRHHIGLEQQPSCKCRLDVSELFGEMNGDTCYIGNNLANKILSELINDFCLLFSWIWLVVTERIRQPVEETRNSADV
jgi:hypothetical protein